MVAAVRVHKVGGPEVLTYEDVPVAEPGPGQVKVRNHACGVNFIDTYFRMGMYPSPVGLPFVSGNGRRQVSRSALVSPKSRSVTASAMSRGLAPMRWSDCCPQTVQ
jgi:hypothetical protein